MSSEANAPPQFKVTDSYKAMPKQQHIYRLNQNLEVTIDTKLINTAQHIHYHIQV